MTASQPITTDAEQSARARQVAEALHSAKMERLPVDDATQADAADYVAGRISADELVARTRARYGLA